MADDYGRAGCSTPCSTSHNENAKEVIHLVPGVNWKRPIELVTKVDKRGDHQTRLRWEPRFHTRNILALIREHPRNGGVAVGNVLYPQSQRQQ